MKMQNLEIVLKFVGDVYGHTYALPLSLVDQFRDDNRNVYTEEYKKVPTKYLKYRVDLNKEYRLVVPIEEVNRVLVLARPWLNKDMPYRAIDMSGEDWYFPEKPFMNKKWWMLNDDMLAWESTDGDISESWAKMYWEQSLQSFEEYSEISQKVIIK